MIYIEDKEKDNTNTDKDNITLEINTAKTYQDILINSSSIERDIYKTLVLNKISLTALIIVFYFIVLKTLQSYDLIQYTYFAFHLIDSNGLLVFLKILNQDMKSIEQQFIKIYDQDLISIQFAELIEVITLYNLKLIYKTCFRNDEYILKYLVECKVHIMLRKVMNNFPNNEKIKKSCLKLFKCQIKFFDKNWRLENQNIITMIYLTLKLKPDGDNIENYLKYEKKDKMFKDNTVVSEYFTSEEFKKIHTDYNMSNYLKFLNNNEEFDRYQNSQYQSSYANLYLKMLKIVEIQAEEEGGDK